jgi:two-component system sensor histidine kinase KdpD
VLKDSDGEDIFDAVAAAAHGQALLSPAVTPVVIEQLTEALERERRRARELEEAHVALVERTARRHELVARLGHELRTPVTVILGVSRMLAAGHLDRSEQAELVNRLTSRAEALVRLVERFETAMDAGSEDLVDVPALVAEVARPLGRVRVDVERGIPLVWANRVLASRIVEEVVDNAIRFSPGEMPVHVGVRRWIDRLEVRVTDRGPGVPPQDRERIFEPLEQGEALDARVHQGAGVGLSLARSAARAMDGDLVLESSGREGSTFVWTVRLPPPG